MSQQGPHFSPHRKAKANDKSQISGKLVSSGISQVAFTSVYSEKNRLNKLMIMIIGRAKQAPHWGVQSRFRVIYVYMYVCMSVCLVCQINCVGGIT